MAPTGILILVADANGNGFGGPSATAFVTGDDVLVGKWDIATHGGNSSGVFSGSTGALSFAGEWGQGDPLAIYWFPTLGASATAPGSAVPYGSFSNGMHDGTDPWTTPADGTSGHKLIFLTTDASSLNAAGGTEPASQGLAFRRTDGNPPAVPSEIVGQAAAGTISIAWTDTSSDETGFRIERSVLGSNVWTLVGTVAAGVNTFTDTSAASHTQYLYRVRAVRNGSWSEASIDIQLGEPPSARLRNLSNRALVGTGHDRLIGSAITVGDPGTQVEVLVVAKGPSLAAHFTDYTGTFLANPMVTLKNLTTQAEITNDNFRDWNSGEIETRFPGFIQDENESGIILKLDAGQNYSAIVEGVGGTTGMAQIEFYEIGDDNQARLRNLSNRALVGAGHDRLIGSAITIGDPDTQVEVLVVAKGPSLAASFPSDYTGTFLADPMMTLRNLTTHAEITNNNFLDWNNGEIEARFPGFIKDSNESGIILNLDAGESYSAIVEGVDEATGMAQIEFYEIVPPPPMIATPEDVEAAYTRFNTGRQTAGLTTFTKAVEGSSDFIPIFNWGIGCSDSFDMHQDLLDPDIHAIGLTPITGISECGLNLTTYHHVPDSEKLRVERAVWDCFTDSKNIQEANDTSCAGRYSFLGGHVKWLPSEVYYTIADGESKRDMFTSYIPWIEEKLNIKVYEASDSKPANLFLHLDTAVPQGCLERAGCSIWQETSATIYINVSDTYFGQVLKHEILHSLLPMGHLPVGNYLMALRPLDPTQTHTLSALEEKLLLLYTHPYLRDGMSMDQFRKYLIIE